MCHFRLSKIAQKLIQNSTQATVFTDTHIDKIAKPSFSDQGGVKRRDL